MELILYIISAIICHFIAEAFIQSKNTRKEKFTNMKILTDYSFSYSLIVSIFGIIIVFGLNAICKNLLMYASLSLVSFIYYLVTYICSAGISKVLAKKIKNIDDILYIQNFLNVFFIMLFLTILNGFLLNV